MPFMPLVPPLSGGQLSGGQLSGGQLSGGQLSRYPIIAACLGLQLSDNEYNR